MVDEDKIFADDYKGEKTIKENKIDVSDDIKKGLGKNTSKRTLGVIGIIILFVFVTVVAWGAGLIGNFEPFDPTKCNYGVHQDFLSLRCITEEEYSEIKIDKVQEDEENNIDETGNGDPFHDVTGATDKVEVTKTKDILGYYMVTTDDSWYGDYVDFRKLPSKLEKEGSMKINFRCYTDEFLQTSTYFGTFRNNVNDYMKVEVFINDIKVNEKETSINKALILEGSCQ